MAVARATCTCATCGKTFEISVKKYNRREADSWEAWASTHYDECSDCRAKRICESRAAENQKAAEESEATGLPELRGSEKQIAWATTIRQQFYDALNSYVAIRKEQCGDEEFSLLYISDNSERVIKFTFSDLMTYMFINLTKASFWIDNRFDIRDFAKYPEYYERYLMHIVFQIRNTFGTYLEETGHEITDNPKSDEIEFGTRRSWI